MKLVISVLFVLLSFLSVSTTYAAPSSTKNSVQASKSIEQVNVNKADANRLSEVLKGVGLKKAEAIIEYRKKYGAFKKVEDLLAVKGIGPKTLEANKSRIILR